MLYLLRWGSPTCQLAFTNITSYGCMAMPSYVPAHPQACLRQAEMLMVRDARH